MSDTSKSSKNTTPDGISFTKFFETWFVTLTNYLDKLNRLLTKSHLESELVSLVVEVLSHYQHYYETITKAASENVFLLFSPPWLTTFEQTFLWIAGFKPSIAFRIVDASVGGELTIRQLEKIDKLIAETRVTEKVLSDEMATIQKSIAGSPFVKIATRMDTRVVDEELNIEIGKIKASLRELVLNADLLRANIAKELVNILSPVQDAKFLAAAVQYQLRIHNFGLQKHADRNAT